MSLDVSQLPVIALGVITLVALLVGVLFTRLGLSSSLGYIFSGIFLGPMALGFMVPGEPITLLFGEIGVLMLLFYLGLELSIEKFKKNGVVALILASVEMATAFVAGFAVAKFFGFGDVEAIVVGSLLPATSTVIALKFMLEKKILDRFESQIAVSALIIEDFFAILVLVLLTSFSAATSFNFLVLNGLFFVVAMFVVVRRFSPLALSYLAQIGHEDKMALYAVGVGIVVGYFGQLLGLSPALGAYFAGFALAESKYGVRIKRELGLFREFFILFFFVSFGATVIFPASITLYALLACLLVAYLVAKILAYGVFGSAIGLNTKSAITTGMLMLSIGEFSIIIAAAAAPLVSNPADITALAFLLTITTGFLAPVCFARSDRIADAFLRVYPKRIRNALSVVGQEMHAVEAFSKAFEKPFWRSVQNLLANFVIALAVVYVAALLNTYFIFPAFPDLPSSATLAVLVLPFIVWPIYRSLQELKFLVETLVRHLVHPVLVERASELFVGTFLALSSLFVAAWLYFQKTPPLFILLPGVYFVLALVFLSRAVWSFFDRLESVASLAGGADASTRRLANAFDAEGLALDRLNDLRVVSKDKISSALRSGKPGLARKRLSDFQKDRSRLLRPASFRRSRKPRR
ncbi:cation:proton antiporter [Candidatus Micrarchaeota archaeon]|nr:cation:proton antiporter [Candidatus Micrarchaeota archaeon]